MQHYPAQLGRNVRRGFRQSIIEHIGQLRCRNPYHTIGGCWPHNAAFLQTFGVERHADAVVPKDFHKIAADSTKDSKDRRHADPGRAFAEPAAPARSCRAAYRCAQPPARRATLAGKAINGVPAHPAPGAERLLHTGPDPNPVAALQVRYR